VIVVWKHLKNPYSVASDSRHSILYYGSITTHAIDDYIDALQYVEKDISDNDAILKQIEIAYDLKDIKDRLEKVRKKLKANNVELYYRSQS
jgi:hypothetical protein